MPPKPKPPPKYGGNITKFFNSSRIASQNSQQTTASDIGADDNTFGTQTTQPAVTSAPDLTASQPSSAVEQHINTIPARIAQRDEAKARLRQDLAAARAAAAAEGPSMFATLNEAQRNAVLAPVNLPLMVVAGAGTGKTFTVIQRLRYMILLQNIHPSNILFISFTRKAAKEAEERLEKMGLPGAELINVGTFHSFCFTLLCRYYKVLDFEKVPKIFSEKKDLKDVMACALRRLNVDKCWEQLAGFAQVPQTGTPCWQDAIDSLRVSHPEQYAEACKQTVVWYSEVCAVKKKKKPVEAKPKAKAKPNKKRGQVDTTDVNTSPLKQARLDLGLYSSPADGEGGSQLEPVPASTPLQGATDAVALEVASFAGPSGVVSASAAAGGGIHAAAEGDVDKSGEEQDDNTLLRLATDGNLDAMPSQFAAALKIHLLAQMIKKENPIAYNALPVVKQSAKNKKLPDRAAALMLAKPSVKELNENLRTVDQIKSRGHNLEQLVPNTARVLHYYTEELRARGAVDFNDLLLLVRDLLLKSPAIAERVRQQHPHILVDEFQDTNAVQMEIVGALVPPEEFQEPEETRQASSLTVVGDGDQSIYSFRGAEPHVLHAFKTVYDHAQLRHRLELNYRSTAKVLDVAAATLVGNTDRDPDERLIPTKSGPAANVVVNMLQTPDDEARWVVEQIEQQHAAGTDYEDIAVLFRIFKSLYGRTYAPITQALEARNIPYRIVRALNLLQRAEVKDVLSYLDLVLDPSNDGAVLRAINTPKRGLGDVTQKRLLALQDQVETERSVDGRQQQQQHRPTLLECCRILAASGEAAPRARRSLESFVELIEVLRVEAMTLRPPEVLDRIVERTGYLEYLEKLKEKKRKKDAEDDEGGGGGGDGDEDDAGAEEEEGDDGDDNSDDDDDNDESDDADAKGLEGEAPHLQFDLRCTTLSGPLKRLIGEAKRWVAQRAEQLNLQLFGNEGQGDMGPPSLESLCYDALATPQGLAVLRGVIDAGCGTGTVGSNGASSVALEMVASANACGLAALADFKSFLQLGQSDVDFSSKTKKEILSSADKGVTISTIHAAKGLEWKVVFMPHFNLGILPGAPRIEEDEDPVQAEHDYEVYLEEERRLAHVGTTRAKDHLYYSYVEENSWGPLKISPILETVIMRCADSIDDLRRPRNSEEDY